METSGEGPYKAAMKLKENSRINRSGYGELKVKVWDRDRNMAAALSNSLLQKIKDLHQHLQNESNENLLKLVKQDQVKTQDLYRKVSDSVNNASGADAEILGSRKASLLEQLQQHEKLINQYEFALLANPPVLLTVENARPPLWADKPKTLPIILFTAFGAMIFSFLLSVFMLSRKR
jgi:hypothetical protein